MKVGRYYVLNKYHALLAVAAVFALAAAVVALAGSIPAALASLTATPREKRVIRCTDRPDNVVCLTFDAYGSDDNISQICDILSEHGVRATFFVTGAWASRFSDSAALLHESGHSIMNSADNVSGLALLPKAKIIEKINRCGDIIEAVTGERPAFFRPPDGEYSESLFNALSEFEMLPVGWDVDSYDDKGLDKEGIVKRVTSLVSPGSIVRFNVDGENTVKALPDVLAKLKEKGFRFFTIPEMVYTENYMIDSQGRQVAIKK